MVGVFGAEMTVHFSPKDPRLSAGVLGTGFKQYGLDCFGQFQDELTDH